MYLPHQPGLDVTVYDLYSTWNNFCQRQSRLPISKLLLLLLETCDENYISARAWQNQQNDLCIQLQLRQAWASAQLDQSSLYTWRRSGSFAIKKTYSKDCPDWVDVRLIWPFAGHTVNFVGLSFPAQFLYKLSFYNRNKLTWYTERVLKHPIWVLGHFNDITVMILSFWIDRPEQTV